MRTGVMLVLCCGLAVGPAAAQSPNPEAQALVDQVNLDSLVHHVRVLTGETPVRLGDSLVTITTRGAYTLGNRRAADYLRLTLQRYGLSVEERSFPWNCQGGSCPTGTNVLGIQAGSDPSGAYYVIGAHYDSYAVDGTVQFERAPGADDNASGTAAVLEAARLLSRLETRDGILYAFWDLEELGLVGSRVYAQQARAKGESILGVINLDMIGYDGADTGGYWFVGDVDHPAFTEATVHVNETYGIGLTAAEIVWGEGRSDHASFWSAGYPAVMFTEGWWPERGDVYPFYHTVDDRLEHFNLETFHRRARLATAALGHLALETDAGTGREERDPSSVLGASVQAFPNPFQGRTTITYELPNDGPVRIAVFDLLGRDVATLVDARQGAGSHAATWTAGANLPAGVYFVRLFAAGRASAHRVLHVR